MSVRTTILRLIKALVLWAVLGISLFVSLQILSRVVGWHCGSEWLALGSLFLLHLLATAVSPPGGNEQRE